MTTVVLTPMERTLIERAAAHSMAEAMLTPAARFQCGVTDLEVARVMRALEAGTPIERNRNGRWCAPSGSPVNSRTLSVTVNECIRTGLIVHYRTGALIPAMVHFKVWGDSGRAWSGCLVPGEHQGPKRVRLHADPLMVDCLACLDRL